jgi:hypothetical protein
MPDANAPPLHCPTASIMRYYRSAGASVPTGLARLAWNSATELDHVSEAARTAILRERGERREATQLANATRRAAVVARRDEYTQQSAAHVATLSGERAAQKETRAAGRAGHIETRDGNMTAQIETRAANKTARGETRAANRTAHETTRARTRTRDQIVVQTLLAAAAA